MNVIALNFYSLIKVLPDFPGTNPFKSLKSLQKQGIHFKMLFKIFLPYTYTAGFTHQEITFI